MNVSPINKTSFGTGLKTAMISKPIDRSILKSCSSDLKSLCGPQEVKKAKRWVAYYTAKNAILGAATAQLGGLGVAVLSTIEAEMALHILKGIYKFKLSDTAVKVLGAGVSGAYLGTKTFDLAAKSIFAFFPGIGNAGNAIVSGTVTASIGGSIIALAEQMEKAQKRGESIDKFIEAMEEPSEEKEKSIKGVDDVNHK